MYTLPEICIFPKQGRRLRLIKESRNLKYDKKQKSNLEQESRMEGIAGR